MKKVVKCVLLFSVVFALGLPQSAVSESGKNLVASRVQKSDFTEPPPVIKEKPDVSDVLAAPSTPTGFTIILKPGKKAKKPAVNSHQMQGNALNR